MLPAEVRKEGAQDHLTRFKSREDWAFSLRLWYITVWHRKLLSGGAPFSMQPTAFILISTPLRA
jgi:hypothetical protein